MYRAIADYQPMSPNDITLHEGDTFNKILDIYNGWAVGTNQSTGQTGYFPLTYVTSVDTPRPGILRRFTAKKPKVPFLHPSTQAVQSVTDDLSTANDESICNSPNTFTEATPCVSKRRFSTCKPPNTADIELDNIKAENENTTDEGITSKREFIGDEADANIVHKLFDSERGQFKVPKACFGAFMGLIAGSILFLLLHFIFKLPLNFAGFTALGWTVIFSVGLASSVHFRCISLLMVPSLATSKGRTAILTIIFGLVLAGPVNNIAENTTSISRSMACSTSLVYNQTLDLKRQLQAPLNNISIQFENNCKIVKEISRKIASVFAPIRSGLNAIANGAEAASNSLNAASQTCNGIFTDAYRDCVKEINNAKMACMDALGWIGRRKRREVLEFFRKHKKVEQVLLMKGIRKLRYKRGLEQICNILSIDVLCGVLKFTQNICAPVTLLDQAANEIAKGASSEVDKIDGWFDFNAVRRTIHEHSGFENLTDSVTRIMHTTQADLSDKVSMVETFVSILSKLLAFTLLLLLFQSFLYLKNFLSKDDFNNNYITSDFKRFDEECKENGRPFVLPLLKHERKAYIDTKSLKLNKPELKMSLFGLLTVLLHIVMTCFIVFFDYLLHYILYIVNTYGNVSIEVKGQSSILLEVAGTGVMANLIRQIVSAINIQSDYKAHYNITECLPLPKEPNKDNLYVVIILYILVIFCVFLQAYGLRLRRKICVFYYPEQERERILFLHKKILNNRTTYKLGLKQHMRSMKKKKRVYKELGLTSKIQTALPFLILSHKQEVRTCLNCGTSEDYEHPFTICGNYNCRTEYCVKCYSDLQQSCIVCAWRNTPAI